MLYTLIAFCISVITIPVVIKLCNTYGWYDTINNRKVHTGNIPRLGGIGFVSAFIIAAFLYAMFDNAIHLKGVIPILIAGLFIFIFGVIDDFKDLPAKFKLLIQIIAALILVSNNFIFTQIGPLHLGFIGYIITFIWIIGVINAFNLIDGVDALCGGLSFFIINTVGIIYLVSNVKAVATLCFILSAAILGFLVYNKPKAKIFMGDGGSQFLGFMVAILPLYPVSIPSFSYNKLAIIFVLASIPILDTFAAMWRRTREHRSFFSPDRSHLHHKLMNMGYGTIGILTLLYSLQLGLCAAVLVSAWIGGIRSLIILLGCFIAMIGFFSIIHYTNRAVMRAYKIQKSDEQK